MKESFRIVHKKARYIHMSYLAFLILFNFYQPSTATLLGASSFDNSLENFLNTKIVIITDIKSDVAPASHTPFNPLNIGNIIKHGIKRITCLNKLKNIDIFTLPID